MQQFPGPFRKENFDIYLERDRKRIRTIDYPELDLLLRDLSFIRWKATTESTLLGADMLYFEMFQLPYWDFLFIQGYLRDHEVKNIQDGCLLMFAMYLLQVYGDNDENETPVIFQNNNLEKILEALYYFEPVNDVQKETVKKLFYLSRHVKDEPVINWELDNPYVTLVRKEIDACCKWLYKQYVHDYYVNTTNSLRDNSFIDTCGWNIAED